MKAVFSGLKLFFILLFSILIPGGAFIVGLIGWWAYTGLQGKRDAPVVRLARMLGNDNDEVVKMAKAMATDRNAAYQSKAFVDAVFEEMHPDKTSDIEALVPFIEGVKSRDRRLAARFVVMDWKASGSDVTDIFDFMIASTGAKAPTVAERAAMLEENRAARRRIWVGSDPARALRPLLQGSRPAHRQC